MKVLFVSSGNHSGKPKVVVYNQALSLLEKDITVIFFPIMGRQITGYLGNIIPLIKHLKNNQTYDLIHSHYSLSAFVTTIACFIKSSIPHIVSLMGSDAQKKGICKYLIIFFNRFFWKATIVKSQSMAIDLGLKNAKIIPNGVDISKIMTLEALTGNDASSCSSTGAKTILFAADPGRMEKNYLLAEKVVNRINRPAILKVIYNVSHDKVLKELLTADLLLLTSLWEGSPNIIKEAMACNCPIVATNVGDISWLFGNEPGHFLTTFEPADVAAKIKQALEFSDTFGRTNGRKRILELELDSESIARRIAEVYEEVINRTRFSGKR